MFNNMEPIRLRQTMLNVNQKSLILIQMEDFINNSTWVDTYTIKSTSNVL